MTDSPADGLAELVGERLVRDVVRILLRQPATQAEIVKALDVAQSSVSRVLGLLKAARLVTVTGSRAGTISVRAGDETVAVLAAFDRLAEAVAKLDAEAQMTRSRETRRLGVRPVQDGAAADSRGASAEN